LCDEYLSWVLYLSFKEEDCAPLYDYKLNVVKRVLLGKKCVCDIEESKIIHVFRALVL
jgi:hypothetical protein